MFRAWNKTTKEYNYFVVVTTFQDNSVGVAAGLLNNQECGSSENFILELWTGLLDKNKKRIYFGDIVSKYDEEEEKDVRVVSQITGHTEIGCFNYYDDSSDFTIVGNIHENHS